MSKMYRTRIAGTGSYLPEKKLTNQDLEKMVDTNDQWIVERTGISSRSMAAEGECTSDLSLVAAKRAFEVADISPQEIDAIIMATTSPDYLMPSTACQLQYKLGAKNGMAFDLAAACTGFVYGLSIANQFISTGVFKNVLVVGAEVIHHHVDYTDRGTCILFGDGAGAAIVSRAKEDEESLIYSQHLHAEGALGDLLYIPSGGSVKPLTPEGLQAGEHLIKMKGRDIFKHAVRTMSQCCKEALAHNNMSADEVDWVVPHQANTRIIEAVARHFGIPMAKVIDVIEHMGNTSAATIPYALDQSIRNGKIKRGQNLLLTAFGGGLTSGSLLLKY